jgi:hypothetical protein
MLPDAAATTCPSCGATLVGEGEAQVPGVTALDPTAIIRGARPIPRPRSRLLAWISGEDADDGSPAAPGSLSPPTPDVAVEMLRLEIEAEVADLAAEAESMAAEAELEAREAGRLATSSNGAPEADTDEQERGPSEPLVEPASPTESSEHTTPA